MKLINLINMQVRLMVNKTGFKFAFSCTMFYSIISYLKYLIEYKNLDIFYFQTSQFLFCGNEYSTFWGIFEVIFPFLIVLPFSLSFIDDINTGSISYIACRTSRNHYFISKLTACFIGGFTIICIPFLINLLLCTITFSNNNNSIIGAYNSITYAEKLTGLDVIINTHFKQLPMLKLYIYSPLLYNIVFTFILSFFSGILSMFVGSCSFILRKHKLFLFLPVYFVFMFGNILDSIVRFNNDKIYYTNYRWLSYAHVNFSTGKNYLVFGLLIFFLITICILIVQHTTRKDVI